MEKHKCKKIKCNISISRTDLWPGNHDDHGDHEEIGGCMRKLQSKFLIASCRTYWDSYFLSVQKSFLSPSLAENVKLYQRIFLLAPRFAKLHGWKNFPRVRTSSKSLNPCFCIFLRSFPSCGWLWNIRLKTRGGANSSHVY